jgi:hypothetical protein
MPENVQQNDHKLEAPSLLDLSAEIVANNEHLLISCSKHLSGLFSQPSSSSRIAASELISSRNLSSGLGYGQSRVVGLRDQAAEQALIQHQTSTNKPKKASTVQGLLPVRASEAVLQKICENWREAEQPSSPEVPLTSLTTSSTSICLP